MNTDFFFSFFLHHPTNNKEGSSESENVINVIKCVFKSGKDVYAFIDQITKYREDAMFGKCAHNEAKHANVPYLACVMSFP